MVFFCCDSCGESLKKNQVDKHGYRCRVSTYSCLDCQVRFTPHTYGQHLKCITENQKYGGKNYVEKEAKGELKQTAWCEQVQRAIEFVKDPSLKDLLERIQGFGNIPRKEPKFINFLTNSCRIRNPTLCQRAWKAIADEAEKLKKEADAEKLKEEEAKATKTINVESNVTDSSTEQAANTIKDTNDSQVAVVEPIKSAEASGNFKWKATIKRKLKEAGGELKVKKLKKVVLREYNEICGDCDGVDEMFDEKLSKAGVTLDGKTVTLV